MQALLANPAVRQYGRKYARQAGLATIRFLGRSRASRANRGRYYFGRRIGVPPKIGYTRPPPLVRTKKTSVPMARSATVSTSPAAQTQTAVGSEWLLDVSNTQAGKSTSVTSYPINPAEPTTFPRLSNIAVQYQKYEFMGLVITYTPQCPSTQKGVVYIAPVRDPTAPLPQNPMEMNGLAGCKSCSAHDEMTFRIPVSLLSSALRGFYCEPPTGVFPDEDDVMKTCGRLVVMTDGILQADQVVGKIITQYAFKLSDPKTVPEGAALSGELDYGDTQFNDGEDVNPQTAHEVVGKPAVYALNTTEWQKRSMGPVRLEIRGINADAGTTATPTLTLDGTVLHYDEFHTRNGVLNQHGWIWHLPYGRSKFTLSFDHAMWKLKVQSLSVSRDAANLSYGVLS